MEPKKNKKSDLERKKSLYLEIGFVIILAFLLVAFEWGTSEISYKDKDDKPKTEIPEIVIENTKSKPQEVIPPVPPIDEIVIIDDEEPELDFPENFFDLETDVVNTIYYPENEPEPEINDLPPSIVEKMPQYRNGSAKNFQKHVQQLVEYPYQALVLNLNGKVYIQFIIDKNGKLVKPEIIKSPDILLSNAVLDALKNTETWEPGEQHGIKVPVTFTIPVIFKLN